MHIVVLITCANKEEAEKIANGLVEGKLAACVNIVAGVNSIFHWQGKLDKAEEILLIAKTQEAKLAAVIDKVKSLHSYEVPEVIALPITGGYAPYLKWIDGSLG